MLLGCRMLGYNTVRLPFRYRDLDEQYPKDYVSAGITHRPVLNNCCLWCSHDCMHAAVDCIAIRICCCRMLLSATSVWLPFTMQTVKCWDMSTEDMRRRLMDYWTDKQLPGNKASVWRNSGYCNKYGRQLHCL